MENAADTWASKTCAAGQALFHNFPPAAGAHIWRECGNIKRYVFMSLCLCRNTISCGSGMPGHDLDGYYAVSPPLGQVGGRSDDEN